MPLADCNALLGTGEGSKDVVQAPRREFNGSLDSVNDPSKDNLASAPVGMPLSKLLVRDGFLMQGGVAVTPGMENFINGVEEHAACPCLDRRRPLDELKKVVNINVIEF